MTSSWTPGPGGEGGRTARSGIRRLHAVVSAALSHLAAITNPIAAAALSLNVVEATATVRIRATGCARGVGSHRRDEYASTRPPRFSRILIMIPFSRDRVSGLDESSRRRSCSRWMRRRSSVLRAAMFERTCKGVAPTVGVCHATAPSHALTTGEEVDGAGVG